MIYLSITKRSLKVYFYIVKEKEKKGNSMITANLIENKQTHIHTSTQHIYNFKTFFKNIVHIYLKLLFNSNKDVK